jgi:hypothetical protein
MTISLLRRELNTVGCVLEVGRACAGSKRLHGLSPNLSLYIGHRFAKRAAELEQ